MTELILGALLTCLALILAVRKQRFRKAMLNRAADEADGSHPDSAADSTPSQRLITSSGPVRVALIARFGSTWASRTTEEIARDPALADRLGSELAGAIIVYLERVDEAKFAGKEFTDVDEWISTAQAFLSQVPSSVPKNQQPV